MEERDAKPGERIIVHVDADLEDLIPGFLENRRKDIASMREALGRGDYQTIQILGHSMKGSGGGYGFSRISEIGHSLDQAATERDSDGIRKWVSELATYLERVEVVYQ